MILLQCRYLLNVNARFYGIYLLIAIGLFEAPVYFEVCYAYIWQLSDSGSQLGYLPFH